jgi:hypothetical protein
MLGPIPRRAAIASHAGTESVGVRLHLAVSASLSLVASPGPPFERLTGVAHRADGNTASLLGFV